MKKLFYTISIALFATLLFSFGVTDNEKSTYKRLPIVDTYDTISMVTSDNSKIIYEIELVNSEGITIIEEWNDNYGNGYHTLTKEFEFEGQSYQENWHYKDFCLKKISYWYKIDCKKPSENYAVCHGWNSNRRFRKCKSN